MIPCMMRTPKGPDRSVYIEPFLTKLRKHFGCCRYTGIILFSVHSNIYKCILGIQ